MFLLLGLLAPAALAQRQQQDWRAATHIIVPQSRSFAVNPGRDPIAIDNVEARIRILEQTATTTLEISLRNTGSGRAEAVLLLPVPDDAVVSGLLFEGQSAEPTARVLPRDEARRTYDDIVRKIRDPALLEFAGYNLIRSSVFPIEAGGTQKVRLTYENLLEADGDRIDYLLPRSESLDQVCPWTISADVQSRSPISTHYSPSHNLDVQRRSPNHLLVKLADQGTLEPGTFRLSTLLERGGVTASMFSYPDPTVGGGYFLLMAGLPASLDDAQMRIAREVTIVLDRSGSMAGAKLDQAKAAALQVIEGLLENETFNIIDYSTTVSTFSAQPVRRNDESIRRARQYLASLRPTGGTNIHDALVEALRQPVTRGALPIVLFLTDGLPTVGRTNEAQIREMVEQGNPHGRRVFTFGVGHDVNVPLLDRLAEITRATSAFVQPEEDVELKVAKVYQRLWGPVLAGPQLTIRNEDGSVNTQVLQELIPDVLSDLFEGDQLILLGQYRDEQPITFELTGNFLGRERTFTFTFDTSTATTRNAFVPRLWASRRIAYLIDQVRMAGAESEALPLASGSPILLEEKYKELIDEIVRLSTEFGILTEYTSFLATEGTDLSDWNNLVMNCTNELSSKAIATRSGMAAVNQSYNMGWQKGQTVLNFDNKYWNDKLDRVRITSVQQVCDRAFFKRGVRWIDGRIVPKSEAEPAPQPDEVIDFGSDAHLDLVRRLVAEGRQGVVSMQGEILLSVDGRNILIRNGATN